MSSNGPGPSDAQRPTLQPPFEAFCDAVRDLLDQQAATKGYQQTGLTGPNPLYALVSDMAGGPGHACGEIAYKTIRYAKRRDPNDLLKIAAWSYLIWRFDHQGAARGRGLFSKIVKALTLNG